MVAGRLVGARMVTPLSVTTVCSGLDSSTLPPSALAAMSTMTEPGFICLDRSLRHQNRRPSAGHLGGGDDHVHAADERVQFLLLGGLLFSAVSWRA